MSEGREHRRGSRIRRLGTVCVLSLASGCVSTGAAETTGVVPETTTSSSVTSTSATTTMSQPTTTTSSAASEASAQQPPALVAHFPLDGSAENVADPSGDWDGVIHGAVPTKNRFGDSAGAYDFDGDGAVIEVGTRTDGVTGIAASVLDTQAITIAAWFRAAENEERNKWWWWDVVSFADGGHVLGLNGRGAVVAGVQGIADGTYTALGTYLDGRWHHAAMTRDQAGALLIYVDGDARQLLPVEGGSVVNAGLTETEASFNGLVWIGGDPDYEEMFDGSIDDVRIYNYALIPAEVLNLYEG